MLPKIQFNPDIEVKFEHLITHMAEKNKATDDLVRHLEELCNLEFFYSKSLQTIANNISKLVVGKDPIKDIIITLERMIATKQEESGKLAKEIKEDLIPHLRSSINLKAQTELREKLPHARNIRAGMQKKLRTLMNNEQNFRKAVLDVNTLPKNILMADKERAFETYRKKEDQFSESIDSFNSSLDEYMLKFSQICQQFSSLETARKMHFRDSVSKLIIFEIDYIKNLEYNYARYMEHLNKMTTKLTIEDKFLGGEKSLENLKEGTIVQLAKISNKNYIDSFVGKKHVNESLLAEQLKVTQLRSAHQQGELSKQVYHNLVRTMQPILQFIHKNLHVNLLIDVVFFTKQLFMKKGEIKVTLLGSLLAHQIFGDANFWIEYEKKLVGKIEREKAMSIGDEESLQKNYFKILERDLLMLQNVEINPYITKVIENITVKYKIMTSKPSFSSKESSEVNAMKKMPQLKYKVDDDFL